MKLAMLVLITGTLSAQTFNTADTLPQGKWSFYATGSGLFQSGVKGLTYSFGGAAYGLGRADLMAGVNLYTIEGQKQLGVFGGGNLNLLKTKHLSVSTLNLLYTPINRRGDGVPMNWFGGVLVSHTLRGQTFYTGYTAFYSFGQKARGRVFTSPDPVHLVPIGVFIPKGKLGYYVEFNVGPQMSSFGLGVSFTP
jgi:hypothetical protein